jgi:phosphate acetyltransferase
VATIQSEGLLYPVLLGDPERIRDELRTLGGDPGDVEVVDPRVSEGAGGFVETLLELRRARGMDRAQARERVRDPLIRGALMVRAGQVHGSLAGAVNSTADVLRAALWCVGPDDGIKIVSSAFYMVVDSFRDRGPEVITFTDAAVVPDPDASQLAQIAAAASRARRQVVGDSPTVAFLSYSTKGSGTGPSVKKVQRALELFRDMEPGRAGGRGASGRHRSGGVGCASEGTPLGGGWRGEHPCIPRPELRKHRVQVGAASGPGGGGRASHPGPASSL